MLWSFRFVKLKFMNNNLYCLIAIAINTVVYDACKQVAEE